MLRKQCRLGLIGLLGLVLAGGCSPNPATSTHGSADDEAAVRKQFAALQEAVGKSDTDKIWDLMSNKSRSDAERTAEAVRAAYAKASVDEKASQEKELGLPASELAGLTDRGVLKTKRFRHKYHELPESKTEKVTVQGDNATVYYTEPDGDKEKLIFERQEGQWKAWLAIPKPPGR